MEVAAVEGPVKRLGGLGELRLKPGMRSVMCSISSQVAWRQRLARQDREVDLDHLRAIAQATAASSVLRASLQSPGRTSFSATSTSGVTAPKTCGLDSATHSCRSTNMNVS